MAIDAITEGSVAKITSSVPKRMNRKRNVVVMREIAKANNNIRGISTRLNMMKLLKIPIFGLLRR